MKRLLLVAGMVVSGVGCTEDPVDIGDDGAAGSGPVGGVIRTWEGTFLQPGGASWLPSGSDRVQLQQHDDGRFVFVFGVNDPPPPATDPDVGYPEDVPWTSLGTVPRLFPIEGYRYISSTSTLDDEKLHYEITTIHDVWTDWCAMQTGDGDDSNGYSCDTGASGSEGGARVGPDGCFATIDGVETSIDCGKFKLCDVGGPCWCPAEGCQVQPSTAIGDLTRDGPSLDGDIAYYQPVTVHLVEQ